MDFREGGSGGGFPMGWLGRGEDKESSRMLSWFLFHLGAGGPHQWLRPQEERDTMVPRLRPLSW